MLDLPTIKEKLQDRNIKVLAQKTGLGEDALRALKKGTSKNPSHNVVKTISEYLEGAGA